MSFAWPRLLWLLLVPASLLAWELTRRRIAAAAVRPKILQAEIGVQALHLQRDATRVAASRTRPWLLIGLASAIVALARPQWGRLEEPVFDQSREILIAIDLSRSMLATDVKPSRLDRAKLLIQSLLEKLKGERVGLVVFSGTAFLQSPLSSDYEILREFLPAMKPDFLPEGGTNYEAMLTTSLEAFTASAAADRFLIVLSDGEALDDNWRSRAEELKKKSVRVIALGVGTPNGSMIPDGSGGLVKDERGAVVLSKLESGTLQQLAETTNGVYHDASAWIDLAALIDQTVNAGRKGSFAEKNTVRMVERFQWPLALALWCLIVSFYYEFPVRPRTRDIAIAMPRPPAKHAATGSSIAVPVVALSLLLFSALSLCPTNVRAAVKVAPPANPSPAPATPPPALQPGIAPTPLQPPTATAPTPTTPPEPPALGKVVSRLSQKNTLTSPDLSELAHETVNWGRRLKEQGQAVPEGPVRDALAAVDQLEQKGDKAADWSQLRQALEQLLEKPEEKKQDQQNQSDQPQQQNKDQQQNGKNDQQNQQNQSNQSPQQQKQDKPSPSDKQNEQKPSDDKKSDDAQKKDEARNEGSRGEQKKSDAKPSQSLAFGDMKKEPPPPPSSETQKVGGAVEKKEKAEPIDPALARPMEKLEELKSQDAPADLFRMLQADQNQSSQKKSGKNW